MNLNFAAVLLRLRSEVIARPGHALPCKSCKVLRRVLPSAKINCPFATLFEKPARRKLRQKPVERRFQQPRRTDAEQGVFSGLD
jgi:hypothetical protein